MVLAKEGLLLWYDGIRNVGITELHSAETVTWRDLSGNENNGTIVSGKWQDDALIFTKGSTWVNCGKNNTSHVTLEIVFEIASLTDSEHAIFANVQSGGALLALSNTYTEFGVNISGTYYYAVLNSAVELNKKIHLVGTYDGTTVKLYIDGVLISQKSASGVIKTPTDNTVLALGGNPKGSTCSEPILEGKVYVARAYSRALTEEEVLANYEYEQTGRYLTAKYLVKAAGVLYTTGGSILEALEETDVTASLFEEYGTDEMPDWDLLAELTDVEILAWNAETLPVLTATMKATPLPQNIISNAIDLTGPSITGIESMAVTCEGDLIVAVSFDGKESWKAWNGEQWATLSEENAGMDKETLEAVTFEQWHELYSGAETLHIRVTLQDGTQTVTQIYVDFAN